VSPTLVRDERPQPDMRAALLACLDPIEAAFRRIRLGWFCVAVVLIALPAAAQDLPTYDHPLPWEVSTWSPTWGHATGAELRVGALAPLVDHELVTLDRIRLLGQPALVVRGRTSADSNRPREELFVYLLRGPEPRLVWRGLIREFTYQVPAQEVHDLSACLFVTGDSTLEYQVFLQADSLVRWRFAPALARSGRYAWASGQGRFARAGPVTAELYEACEHSGERNPD
jgi:hypothetical protein